MSDFLKNLKECCIPSALPKSYLRMNSISDFIAETNCRSASSAFMISVTIPWSPDLSGVVANSGGPRYFPQAPLSSVDQSPLKRGKLRLLGGGATLYTGVRGRQSFSGAA